MVPIVDGLEEEFVDELTVLRLDAAKPENIMLMQTYGVRGHPAFVLLDTNGRVTQTFFGPQSGDLLREAIQTTILP